MPPTPQQFEVNVLYQGGRVSFPGANGGNITVNQPASTITFTKAQGSDAFSFTTLTTFTPPSSDFAQALDGSGNLVITDSDADVGTYQYCLMIQANGQMVPADPQIVNRPTT